MKKMLKIMGIFLILIIVGIAGFVGYIKLNSADDEPIDDSVLIPKLSNVSSEQNGWFELVKAGATMYYPKEKENLIREMSLGQKWDGTFAQELIQKNQEAYGYINRALEKKYIVQPEFNKLKIDNITTTIVPKILIFRKVNRLLLISARYNLENGNTEEGVKEIVQSLQFGNKVGNKETASTIEYLTGLGLRKMAYLFMNKVVDKIEKRNNASILFQIDNDYNKELQKALAEISKDSNIGLVNSFKWEYAMMKNSLPSILTDSNISKEIQNKVLLPVVLESSYYFKPQQTINLLNKQISARINNVDVCNSDLFQIKRYDYNSFVDRVKAVFTENLVGKVVINIHLGVIDGIHKKHCEEIRDIVSFQEKLSK